MKRVDLDLELLTDVSVPETNRSLGSARSLDYLPGRTLWGAVAAAAFRAGMTQEEGLRRLRSNALRFLDAVPSRTGQRTYPTPRSWHGPKYGEGVLNLCCDGVRANLRGTQVEPLATVWRDTSGREVDVRKRFSLRTSVTAAGRANEGLLFGIDAIGEGTRLNSCIEGEEDNVDWALSLLEGRDLRIGRSRSAEFGRVRCRRAEEASPSLAFVQGPARRIHILCCSRLSLRDPATGSPTFRPRATAFGLPDSWALVPQASFIRTARYSTFNSHWRRPEHDRHVIEVGSVLTFEGARPEDPAELRAKASGGVGSGRAEGMGEIAVHPAWLTEAVGALPQPTSGYSDIAEGSPKPPRDTLYDWATARSRRRAAARLAAQWADHEAERFRRYRLNPSQWGVLRQMGREARHRADGATWLRKELARFVESGVSSLSRGWGSQDGEERAGERLLAIAGDGGDDLPARIELLANRGLRLPGRDDR